MGTIILKSAGSLASFITYASATPMMYRIYKNKSTGEKSHFPLVAMLANCHIWYVPPFKLWPKTSAQLTLFHGCVG